jgi:hypothetical protein
VIAETPTDIAGAIRTFEGRRDLLRGVSEGFFAYNPWASVKQDEVKEILRESQKAVERRNELAHGIVMPYKLEGNSEPSGFCLLPSYYDMKKRDVNSDAPQFAYTAENIDFFADAFRKLQKAPYQVANDVIALVRQRRGRTPPRWS